MKRTGSLTLLVALIFGASLSFVSAEEATTDVSAQVRTGSSTAISLAEQARLEFIKKRLLDLRTEIQALEEELRRIFDGHNEDCAVKVDASGIESSTTGKCFPKQPVCPAIFANLRPGSNSHEVGELQKFLAQDRAIYPEGLVTNYFGPATQRAVERLQRQEGIASDGSPDVNGFGAVGPATRAKIGLRCGNPHDLSPLTPISPDRYNSGLRIEGVPSTLIVGQSVSVKAFHSMQDCVQTNAGFPVCKMAPSEMKEVSVSWVSSNTGKATVSPATGSSTTLQALSPGVVVVTATYGKESTRPTLCTGEVCAAVGVAPPVVVSKTVMIVATSTQNRY